MPLDVRRAQDRFRTATADRETWHAFSFGPHYDPTRTGHGALVLHDEHRLAGGAGFATHPHRGSEILTWVLRGGLAHEDSTGHAGVVRPGTVQRLSAGTGVEHAERNASADEPAHLVQMWVLPDESGPPAYEARDVGDALRGGELVPVASGRPGHDAAVRLRTTSAALHVARLHPGGTVRVPDARRAHLYVAAGRVALEGAGDLAAGDAVLLSDAAGAQVTASGPAEVLVWELG